MTPQTLNAHAADEVAVRDLYEQLMDAWNKAVARPTPLRSPRMVISSVR
jgi:hypothetical protein